MTAVETTVTISISPKGMTLEALEAEISQALQQVGQHLLTQAFQAMETELLERQQLYRWVQHVGTAIVAEEDELQEAVFTHGEILARDPGQREIVLEEVDDTFLRAQREEGPNFELHMGVLASGKALESMTAKHRRYRL